MSSLLLDFSGQYRKRCTTVCKKNCCCPPKVERLCWNRTNECLDECSRERPRECSRERPRECHRECSRERPRACSRERPIACSRERPSVCSRERPHECSRECPRKCPRRNRHLVQKTALATTWTDDSTFYLGPLDNMAGNIYSTLGWIDSDPPFDSGSKLRFDYVISRLMQFIGKCGTTMRVTVSLPIWGVDFATKSPTFGVAVTAQQSWLPTVRWPDIPEEQKRVLSSDFLARVTNDYSNPFFVLFDAMIACVNTGDYITISFYDPSDEFSQSYIEVFCPRVVYKTFK